MSDTPDQQKPSEETPPVTNQGLTRPPTPKPKLKLTKKPFGKTGSKVPMKLGKKSYTPVTLPPFQSSRPSSPEASTSSQEESAPLPPPPLGGLPSDSLQESNVPGDSSMPSPPSFPGESLPPSPPAFGDTGDSTPDLPPVPPAPPSFEESGAADAGLPPPPTPEDSGEEEISDLPAPPVFSEDTEESEASLPPPPPAFGDTGDSTSDLPPVPPAPPSFEESGDADAGLPPPPELGGSADDSTEGNLEETGTDEFEDPEDESTETEFSAEVTADSVEPTLVPDDEKTKDEAEEETTESEPESSEFADDEEDEDPNDEDQGSSEMTPFEISENFRNLKINIMMVKGSLKEMRTHMGEISGDSGGQSGDSDSAQEIESKFSKLAEQFSSAESVLSENSAELQNLSEQFQLFKSSFAEVEDLVRDSSTEVDGDGAGNLKSLESSLESLKQELAESESKREANKKVMLSLLDQFNAFEKSQTGSQATDESVSDGGNDDQSSDDRLSELTEKIVGLSQRIYELENEEPPPPPPIDEKEEFSSDEILTRDDISALVTEQLGEATPVDTSTDLTSRIEELENKLEESLESVRDAEEPPPPPPVPSFNASEEIEELNTKLSQSIDSLEERMSKISDHLKANVDEVDLGDSSSTVVLDGNDDVTNTGSGLSSVDDSVAAVSTSGSEKKELDEVDKLVKVDPQSNYSDSNEISPQMTMNSDDENQDPEVTTEDEAGEQDAVESDGNEELTIKKNTRTYNDSRKYKIKLLKNRNET